MYDYDDGGYNDVYTLDGCWALGAGCWVMYDGTWLTVTNDDG